MTGKPGEWEVNSLCGLAAHYWGKAWPFRGSPIFCPIFLRWGPPPVRRAPALTEKRKRGPATVSRRLTAIRGGKAAYSLRTSGERHSI